ncbi:MAG: hypothetical protein RBU37_27195, partial [Myxococcota bacterium]|nr:hypothetical protein [Myxococcota bacterium]
MLRLNGSGSAYRGHARAPAGSLALLVVLLSAGLSACTFDDDTEFVPSCNDADCGPNGLCDPKGDGCLCLSGYTGEACDQCAEGFQDKDGDGTCRPACSEAYCVDSICNDESGLIRCLCAEGHQDNDGNGRCSPSCAIAALACIHGSCTDQSGEAVCACEEDWAGELCEHCVFGLQDNDGDGQCEPGCSELSCGGGRCDDDDGVVKCICSLGYEGEQCERCTAGYQDNDGNGSCEPDCAHSNLDCGARGRCDDGSGAAVCACDQGY